MRGARDARWEVAPPDPDASGRLVAVLGLHPAVAQALVNRGLTDPAAAAAFLDPRLDRLADPSTLPGMAAAVDRLAEAVRTGRPTVVYGDYDADGVAGTALLVRALQAAGLAAGFYIPHRRDGYGLHADAVRALAAQGARLLVAVDCGIAAADAADAAAAAGADLVILDHHLPLGPLPRAAAIVNPHLGRVTPYCAAGLAFQAARALRAALRLPPPSPDDVAVAAIATVADAVPLLADNRILVAAGLAGPHGATMPGLAALLAAAGLTAPLRVRDLSHGLGPRLNAAGRLAHADLGVRLLLSDDPEECRVLAERLDALNAERRALCDRVLAEAVEEVEQAGVAAAPAIVLAREGWHPGVIGIVASQLVERYLRPVVLIALHDGIGRGSARSIPALHLVDALADAGDVLTAYGGHAMAAGLSVPAAAVARFREVFLAAVAARVPPEAYRPVTAVDAEIGLDAVTPAFAAQVARLAPFGQGNPEPVFLTRGLRAVGTRLVGGGTHLRLVVSDGRRTADAIGFRLGDYAELLAFTQARLDLAYAVEPDRWTGEGAQLVVVDLQAPAVDLGQVTADADLVLERLFTRADDYMDDRADSVEDAEAFHTKVVGVTFEGRQDAVAGVRPGDVLRLVRAPANPRDPHAIEVRRDDGVQVGFLRAALAARLAPAMDAGARYVATATAVTGGGDRALGLNVHIRREAGWGGEVPAASAIPPAVRLSPGADRADLIGRLQAQLMRGRPLEPLARLILEAVLDRRRIAVRAAPGRALPAALALGAASVVLCGDGPAVVVLPTAGEVDAWIRAAAPWLQPLGLQAAAVHGALPAGRQAAVVQALRRGALDVVCTSVLWAAERDPGVGVWLAAGDERSLLADTIRLPAERVRLVAAVAWPGEPSGALDEMARRLGLESVALSLGPRTGVRLADRRGQPVEAAGSRPPDPGLPGARAEPARPDKVLVTASDAIEAVALARDLRPAARDGGRRVAYYHDRLPAALRRVLEDLFAAGTVSDLVAGSLIVPPALPADVSRVVVRGLLPTRWLAAEAIAGADDGGRGLLVDLRLDPAVLDAVGRRLDARFPSRDTLVGCYHYFRALGRAGAWTWPAHPSPAEFHQDTLDAALEIFVEAGVVSGEAGEGGAPRYVLADPGGRVDLERSLRYREGQRVRAAWDDARRWALGPAATILAALAGPV